MNDEQKTKKEQEVPKQEPPKSFLDFFRGWKITIKGEVFKLDYTGEDLYFLEENDFPLADEGKLLELLTTKPMKYGMLLIYAGIGDERRDKITLKDFRKSITEHELNKLGEYVRKAFEALKASLPVAKELPKGVDAKKK